ncbi:MAG: hypothetical protein LUH14_10595 [Clostridiaceae bacterium]|nr:hypothetical protein [Clostridiaceae bacterium]
MSEKKHKKISTQLTYAYLRRVKKWMLCPCCQNGKMRINKASTMWTCENCDYELSADEFEDDYVFWFCDECEAYLNDQDGFDRNASKHICQNCGYENDTTLDNIKGICSDCGKVIADPEATLCEDCRNVRKDKAKKWLINAGKAVGAAALAAGAAYVASALNGETDETGNEPGNLHYSRSWLNSASLEELETEREKVQADYLNINLDMDYRGQMWDLLHTFDVAIGEKKWEGKEPGYPVHSEHGWYLPSDD